MKTVITAIVALILISACTEIITEPVTDTPVVESYLTPGEAATVKLSRLIRFTEDGFTDSTYIDSAAVSVGFNGTDYLLSPVDTAPGLYVCLDSNLVILPENSYKLSFIHDGVSVTSETTVPEKPQNLSLSAIYYYWDPDGILEDYLDPLYVYWDNTDGSYYQIVVEYMDETYNPINEYMDPNNYDSFRKTSTSPINTDTYTLAPRRQLSFWGNYRLIIYKVNKEYVDLYESMSQSSMSITEPPSNIDNGLGIFTGINSDTIMFKLIRI
jgi:hypothetical protein